MAVIGIPDERWGEAGVLVVPDISAVDIEALRERCLNELADYKRPKLVVGHGGPLPRTYSGKITKAVLREAYAKPPADAVLIKK